MNTEQELELLIHWIEQHQVRRGVGAASYHLPKWGTQERLFWAKKALSEKRP